MCRQVIVYARIRTSAFRDVQAYRLERCLKMQVRDDGDGLHLKAAHLWAKVIMRLDMQVHKCRRGRAFALPLSIK